MNRPNSDIPDYRWYARPGWVLKAEKTNSQLTVFAIGYMDYNRLHYLATMFRTRSVSPWYNTLAECNQIDINVGRWPENLNLVELPTGEPEHNLEVLYSTFTPDDDMSMDMLKFYANEIQKLSGNKAAKFAHFLIKHIDILNIENDHLLFELERKAI